MLEQDVPKTTFFLLLSKLLISGRQNSKIAPGFTRSWCAHTFFQLFKQLDNVNTAVKGFR